MEKNVLLTGASRGLGLSIAAELLAEGWSVIALSRGESAELRHLGHQFPGRLRVSVFDLERPEELTAHFKTTIGYDTPLHALVNNAATAYDDLLTNLNPARLEAMFRVNVFSAMILTKLAIRNMLLHNLHGSIVHLSSVSVHTGYKGLSMYAATKGSLEAFSKNTAREWGERGIRSNCVVAGFMETAMSASLDEEQKKRIHARTSLKNPVSVESVAKTVRFLLSDDASSITGQNIFVDNGTI